MATEVRATSLFRGPDRGLADNVVLRHDNGVITEIVESAAPSGPRSLVIPAFVNAHDHARPTASSFGALGMPLESWILRSALGTPVDPYLTAVSALARSARAGCAAMMVHYTRPSGTMPLLEEAKAIGKAAYRCRHPHRLCHCGARPESGRLWRRRAGAVEFFGRRSQDGRATVRPRADVAEGLHRSDRCDCRAIAGPKIDVQLGPAGVQWCSKPLLRSGRGKFRADRPAHPHASAGDRSTSAPGPTRIIRKASCAISATSAFCRSG